MLTTDRILGGIEQPEDIDIGSNAPRLKTCERGYRSRGVKTPLTDLSVVNEAIEQSEAIRKV